MNYIGNIFWQRSLFMSAMFKKSMVRQGRYGAAWGKHMDKGFQKLEQFRQKQLRSLPLHSLSKPMAIHPPYKPYPFPVQFLRVRPGMEIAYMDTGGDGPVLFMIHGLGSYAPSWTKTMQGLEASYRCIALDLPNYGRSTLGEFDISLRWFAEIIRDVIEELEVGTVHLLGHSMGAQIALWCSYLNLFPIEKMVLVAPAGFEKFSQMEQSWFRSVNQVGLIRSMPDQQIRRNFEVNFFRPLEDAGFMLDDRLQLKKNKQAYELYCRMIPQCTQAMLDEPIWDILPDIDHQVLVIFGKEDALIPNKMLHRDQTTEKIAWEGAKRLPAGRLLLVPESGHFPHWEQSDQVNTAITTFIGQSVSDK